MAESEKFCREAARHYENFTVGSLLFPRNKRGDLTNFYAFCRGADDLGDEGDITCEAGRRAAAEAIDAWEKELLLYYEGGKPRHPVFIALQKTIERYNLPLQPFRDLISAFRQDQFVLKYDTFAALLDYCRRSANPVGRLYLMMFDIDDEGLLRLSDKICTALQLTNFLQDVSRDLDKGRIYLPLEDLNRFGCELKQLQSKRFTPQFTELMRFEVERVRKMFDEGALLESKLKPNLAFEVKLFRKGGEEILKLIEKEGYDVLKSRPKLNAMDRGRIFLDTLIGLA